MIRYHRRYNVGSFVSMNMTPMIDVTFQLLTFFMLASNFASAEKPDLSLPNPNGNQAINRRVQEKVILSILYRGRTADPALQCGPMAIGSLTELRSRLEEIARANPNTEVILRADRRIPYGHIRRVMQSVGSSRLSRLQVVTELGDHDARNP